MSNINHKHSNIFIHVPKVAGTSIESFDFVGGNSHASARVMKGIAGKDIWERYFTWGFVRDPLDRFVSSFFHEQLMTHPFRKTVNGFRHFVHFLHAMGFDIDGALDGTGHQHHLFTPQCYFLCDKQDRIIVDFVGRFSQLEQDWGVVLERMGIDYVELPHIRSTDHAHYTSYYDEVTLRMVKELYAKDYEVFKEF